MSKELIKKIEKAGLKLSEVKEAFIIEEMTPYFEDNKLCQRLKVRLAEIKDFKESVKSRIEILKDWIVDNQEEVSPMQLTLELDEIFKEEFGEKLTK